MDHVNKEVAMATAGPSPLEQIQRGAPLVGHVVERLTEAIISETFRAGDKLVETRLAESLGVSRGPIRDAFRQLEQMGLVESRPYQGTVVSTLTPRDVFELYTVRAPIEGMAARLLAEQCDKGAIESLQGILDEMRSESIPARLIELDLRFHNEMVELTGHRLLSDVWSTVYLRLRRFLFLKRSRLYQTTEEAGAIHHEIVAAILSGDPERAERTVRCHILSAQHSAETELAGEAAPDMETDSTPRDQNPPAH